LETLQSRRGWIKAGAADSNTLIETGEYRRYSDRYHAESQFVQFNGNSSTEPYNVQVKDFGSANLRVRARVMVPHPEGYIGLCVRSDAGDEVQGLNLRIRPGIPGLQLYHNNSPLAQTRSHGPATPFALDTWFTLELEVDGLRLFGRLYDDQDSRKLLEQVEVTLPALTEHCHAGILARDKGERADWFQAGVRPQHKGLVPPNF